MPFSRRSRLWICCCRRVSSVLCRLGNASLPLLFYFVPFVRLFCSHRSLLSNSWFALPLIVISGGIPPPVRLYWINVNGTSIDLILYRSMDMYLFFGRNKRQSRRFRWVFFYLISEMAGQCVVISKHVQREIHTKFFSSSTKEEGQPKTMTVLYTGLEYISSF